jgi:glycosyltransferase involved in cell wall biosynthesis
VSPVPPPRISVVVPVKDDAEQLRGCLDALAAQRRRPDEVLIVDNASADDSAAVALAAGARVERCDEAGIPAAAAHGYDLARGDLILRLDADCRPGPAWVATMERAFAERPDVAVLTGGARFVDGPRALRAPLAALYLGTYAVAGVSALGHLPLFGSNLAFRRQAWQEIHGIVHREDAELHDDFDLAFHFGERHRIRYVPRAAMGMSMRPFSSASGFRRRVARGMRTVLLHWPDSFPPSRWRRLVEQRRAAGGGERREAPVAS